MPLYYPDSLQHNNPALPLMDDNQLAGGYVVVADLTARNAYPIAKRKLGMMMTWAVTGTWYRMAYIGADLLDATWQNDTNWINIAINEQNETVDRTIYITTTGNDTTGDGSVGNPYLTITKALSTIKKNIDTDITITISLGVGTFNLTPADINTYNSFIGEGIILTQGTLTLVSSGFTMGAALPADPLTFNVSGGTSGSWTLDQWKFYFLKSGALYYPISHNSLTPTLSTVSAVTGTEIYQAQTILNCTGKFAFKTSRLAAVNFKQLEIDLTNINHGYIKGSVQEIYFKGTGTTTRILGNTDTTMLRCCFNSAKYYSGGFGLTNFNYFYTNANTYCISFDSGVIGGIVIENPSTGSSAGGVYLNAQATSILGLSTQYWKFVNTGHCIHNFSKANMSIYIPALIIVNSPYFIRKNAAVTDYTPNKIIIETTPVGAPSTRWFYDSMSQFINISNGRLNIIPTIIYPENENNLSATLANNTTTNVIVGNKLQNKSISIEYTIKRGTGIRQGRLSIINDGTNLFLSPDIFNDNGVVEVGDPAIVFTVNYNTNEIRLAATLNNSGNAGTMQYDVVRKMNVPLTI